MEKKTDAHVFKGMARDLDPLKQPAEYLVDARNIRMTTRGESTSLAIIPEKSTKSTGILIPGVYIGHCVLNQYVTIFTKVGLDDYPDKIYRVEKGEDSSGNTTYTLELLYEGNLNFDSSYPIDSLGVYENKIIQKVYWTDGLNQPRLINIVSDKRKNANDLWTDSSFDFVPELELGEDVVITKNFGNGSFPAGVIQYVFTYYNKYGQETNIVWQSPLLYLCFTDRGGSPEETVSCSFNISIDNLDTKYDYIRLYSIIRTSLDATPTCRRVQDVDISLANTRTITNEISYSTTTTNVTGEDGSSSYVDNNDLTYVVNTNTPGIKTKFYGYTDEDGNNVKVFETITTVVDEKDDGSSTTETTTETITTTTDTDGNATVITATTLTSVEITVATVTNDDGSETTTRTVTTTTTTTDEEGNESVTVSSVSTATTVTTVTNNDGSETIYTDVVVTTTDENGDVAVTTSGTKVTTATSVETVKTTTDKNGTILSMVTIDKEGNETTEEFETNNTNVTNVTTVVTTAIKVTTVTTNTSGISTTVVSTTTTKDTTVVTEKIVSDISIIDDGMIGDNIDPTELLYIGGEEITAKTLAQKDGTLFLGNLEITRPSLGDMASEIREAFEGGIDQGTRNIYLPNYNDDVLYPQQYTLNAMDGGGTYSTSPMTFKYGEYYRLGVQFQYKNGKWSDPIYLSDEVYDKSDFSIVERNVWQLPVFCSQATNSLSTLYSKLHDMGYRKIRGVVVLPDVTNRRIVAQGLLCPTVYNYRDYVNNSPSCQSSWFLRPFPGANYTNLQVKYPKIMDHNDGDWVQNESEGNVTIDINHVGLAYYHDAVLGAGIDCRAELQGVPRETIWFGTYDYSNTTDRISINYSVPDYYGLLSGNYIQFYHYNYVSYYNSFDPTDTSTNTFFHVNQLVQTFHSPEILWDEDTYSLDYTSLRFHAAGYVYGFNSAGDTLLETSSPPIDGSGAGFIKNTFSAKDSIRTIGCFAGYEDNLVDDNDGELEAYDKGERVKYYVYPWQRTESINNDIPRGANQGTRTTVLSKKIWSDIKIGLHTKLFPDGVNNDKLWFPDAQVRLFNSDEVSVEKFTNVDGNSRTYYGNVDTVINPVLPYTPYWRHNGDNYTIGSGDENISSSDKYSMYEVKHGGIYANTSNPFKGGKNTHIGDSNKSLRSQKSYIRMKYKSTPHLIVYPSTNSSGTNFWTLGYRLMNPTSYASYTDAQVTSPYMMLGEIYRDIDTDNLFGGTSDDIMQQLTWLPAGEAVSIEDPNSVTFDWSWGDCYQQRFDFLKTYPYTTDDENQIVEIGSFIVESRVNCDGRYDRNKGFVSNLSVTSQNFNLHNPVYNQKNNFFTYKIMDSSYYDVSQYSNQITWTTEHTAVADVDKWTNITLGSVFDLDGTKGEITAIRQYNDNLYVFLNKEICRILFNSRVQLNTSDGVPIEISNNYKVDGVQVVNDSLGCDELMSIVVAPAGIYFIDTNTKNLYVLGGEGLTDISTTHYMSTWFKSLANRPKLHYDFNEGDLYVRDTSTCLNYSEMIAEFVSFFDYQDALAMFNVQDDFLGITYENEDSVDSLLLWKFGQGSSVCDFFNLTYPVELSFISNAEPGANKIFTNLDIQVDWRSIDDLGDGTGVNYDRSVNKYNFFDTLRVSNEYQDTGKVDLVELRERPSNLKNKLRVWRVHVPRDKTNVRQRISNPWARFTLEKSTHPYPFILHDLDVTYHA